VDEKRDERLLLALFPRTVTQCSLKEGDKEEDMVTCSVLAVICPM